MMKDLTREHPDKSFMALSAAYVSQRYVSTDIQLLQTAVLPVVLQERMPWRR